MLYVTTRNQQNPVTASHPLLENRGADGGLFVPLNVPMLTEKEIKKLSEMSFGQCVAEILNLFFQTKLTGWDVDFCIGRYPVRMEQLGHKIFMAETWHNPEWQYKRLERNLLELLQTEIGASGSWGCVAIRMGVLAGILGKQEILEQGAVDVSFVAGDFTGPISAWYLRRMGFPIANIICCCNENNQFWDLICNEQMQTEKTGISTIVPEADIVNPVNLERLIFACGGILEVERFLECCRCGTVYAVSGSMLQQLRQGLFASVISSNRAETTIPNVYKSHHYVLSPASALAYSGFLDYRARTGTVRTAVVICDSNPVCYASVVAEAMGIPVEQLQKLV